MDKLKQTMTDKGCVGSVKFSDEDGVPLAKCRRSQLDFYEGETREAMEVDFREAVDAYLELCQEI